MEHREGVGEKREQLMTRMSMDFGSVPVFFNAFLTQSYMTVWNKMNKIKRSEEKLIEEAKKLR